GTRDRRWSSLPCATQERRDGHQAGELKTPDTESAARVSRARPTTAASRYAALFRRLAPTGRAGRRRYWRSISSWVTVRSGCLAADALAYRTLSQVRSLPIPNTDSRSWPA